MATTKQKPKPLPRNQAEQLTYQAERTLKDLGDKVPAEDRAAAGQPALDQSFADPSGIEARAFQAKKRQLIEGVY